MTQTVPLSQATDTRELIIESAYACFGKHGLQKATIVDIA
jgi:AcrR family transcriptional regulator